MESESKEIENEINRLKDRRPDSDDEAQSRFEDWRRCDPYPEVGTGLLSAPRFCDYIAETGMIYPFNVSKDDIKLATYAFRVEGKVVRWTKKNEKQSFTVGRGSQYDTTSFQLRQDSIAFVTLEPFLRIPEYIALRFNLKINNVYRGLLLGTGPIVDPGYEGKLSIPLHNLTTNHYVVEANERLVWVEFTKIHKPSRVDVDKEADLKKSKIHVPFFEEGDEREERDVEYHIREAEPHRSIRSSIPNAIYAAEQAAEEAREEAAEVGTQSSRSFYISLLVIILGFASLTGVVVSYFFSVYGLEDRIAKQEARIEYLQEQHRTDTNSPHVDSSGNAEDQELNE